MMSARAGLRPGTAAARSGDMSCSMSRMCSSSTRGITCRARLRALAFPAREIDRREVRERAARADDLRRVPVARREHARAARRGRACGACALPFVLRRRARNSLGQSDRAEGQRDQSLDETVGAQRQLERAAADVHDHRAPDVRVEVRERAAEARDALRPRREDSDLESGLRRGPARETRSPLLASRTALVATTSMRLTPSWLASVAMRAERAERILNRDLAECFHVLWKSRAQPRRRLHFVDDPNDALGETSATSAGSNSSRCRWPRCGRPHRLSRGTPVLLRLQI